jgi:hypothetical protein
MIMDWRAKLEKMGLGGVKAMLESVEEQFQNPMEQTAFDMGLSRLADFPIAEAKKIACMESLLEEGIADDRQYGDIVAEYFGEDEEEEDEDDN